MVQQATLVSAFVTFNTAIIIMAWSMLMKKNEMPVKGRVRRPQIFVYPAKLMKDRPSLLQARLKGWV